MVLHQAEVPDHVVIGVTDLLRQLRHQHALGEDGAVRLAAVRKILEKENRINKMTSKTIRQT